MNILAIRFARLGDIILLLPTLARIKASLPDCRLTFLTGHRCAPIARMCPAIDEVISVDRIAMRDGPIVDAIGGMWELVQDVRERRFDLVLDFHGLSETNLLTRLSGAPRRLGLQRFDQTYLPFCFNEPPVAEDKSLHVSRMFMKVAERLGCTTEGAAALVVPEEERAVIDPACSSRVVLYVDAPVPERVWPIERFAKVADYVVKDLGAEVTVVSGPGRRIESPPGDARVMNDLSIPELAALIQSADLLVSNDTGPMHFGPALGVPTLGIFSVGLPEHFAPTGPHDVWLRGNPIEKVAVEDVLGALQRMWRTTAGYRDLRR